MIAPSETKGKRRVIGIFILAMLNVSIMASLRNLPLVAQFEFSSVFFFFAVAIGFLIPCALVSAELATGWPKGGGIYIWVREALGDRWGFFAIWMQWVHNVTWYPAILSFVAATLAYVFNPSLADNKVYILTNVLVGFWGMTIINNLGIRTSSLFSTIGVIIGTILPGALIIGLGVTWFGMGNPSQISFAPKELLPDLSNIGNLVFLAGLFLAFAGLEVTAVYAGETKNPQKNFPRAIILAAIITFFLFMLGALAIAVVIPQKEISLVSGLMEAFKVFFHFYNLDWILPIMGVLLVIGAIAEVNAWIGGPVKGLHATAIRGDLPPMLQKMNKHLMPTNLLIFQGIIVTVAAFVFLFMPSVSSSYWILSALSAQTYLIMYVLMFISAIKLRYSKPHVPRAYSIPYRQHGMWLVAGLGILSSCFGFFIGFIPPSKLDTGSLLFYESFLILGVLIMCGIPLIIHQYRKPEWFLEVNKTSS